MKIRKKKVSVKGTEVMIFSKKNQEYISLTDIARYRDKKRCDYIISNWLRNRNTIEFLGFWEMINNPDFKAIEFDGFRKRSGLNSFILTPKRWISKTNAIGLISKSGRYGGTYAHKDIAFEFASWISIEFKIYLIKEFQRLKDEESRRLNLNWNLKREFARINYKIHTDAIRENLIPPEVSEDDAKKIYADEADVLNKALFGMTSKEGYRKNKLNIRDNASMQQLVVLANLESMNSEYIKQGIPQSKRIIDLNKVAISQMKSLLGLFPRKPDKNILKS